MSDLLTSPRLRLAVCAVLGLLVLVQAVRLALMLATPPSLSITPPAVAVVDPAVLTRFDPFFRGEAMASQTQGDPGGWVLYAVRAGGGSFDTAIISGADGRQVVYRVGEAVGPGVILDSVAQDHVMLSRGGALTRLDFPDTPPAAAAAGTQAPPAAVSSGPTQTMPTISPTRFVGDASLRPRMADGRVNGFVIHPRGRAETLAAAGLRSGDVIVAVNGLPMTSAERAADLESDLGGNEIAEIQYERDGQTHTATVRIDPRGQ